MKQKVVIKVSLNDQKSCTKAMKTAFGVDGVVQAALQQEKNQIEVTGDGIDVVLLATLLRKCLKHAEVVSVSPVDDKNKPESQAPMMVWTSDPPVTYYHPVFSGPAPYISYAYNDSPPCSIM